MSEPTRIAVDGDAPYHVVIGRGVLAEVLPALAGASAVAVVHAPPMRTQAVELQRLVREAGLRAELVALPEGEAAKDLPALATLWEAFAAARLGRTDAVVSVGGGATTDVAGFAAATWLRGVRVVHVPTSLLGMVDAAVGGKTGINTSAGKNLVGSFHPPVGVVCDLELLATLPPEEWVSGMAEVVKCGFIADPLILDRIEGDLYGARSVRGPYTQELVERSVAVKADVVSSDLREAGLREVLNYGHTLGHAIESVEGYRWRHGAAISVGMAYAAALARRSGRLDEQTAARHTEVLSALGLPTSYARDAWPALHAAMAMDKKSRGGKLRFVVLEGLAKPGTLEDPDPELLEAAYAEVAQ